MEYGVLENGKPFDTVNLYSQVTYPFSDVLRGTLGLRYSETDQQYSYELYLTENPCSNPNAFTVVCPTTDTLVENANYSASEKQNNTDWKVGFEYDLTEESMLYGNIATGFKAGGVQLRDSSEAITSLSEPLELGSFNPEKTLSYELGMKNRLFDNKLQLNGAVFYTEWDDLQINTFTCPASTPDCIPGSGDSFAVFLNVADSTQYGLEFDSVWLVTDNDRVNFSGTAMHGRYGDGGYYGFGGTYIDLTDKKMVQVPAFAANLGYSHVFKIGAGSLTATVEGEYSSEYETTHESNLDGHTQPSYFRNNISLTYEYESIIVNAYVRNIQEESTIQSVFPFGVQASDPRLYGVSVSYDF